MADIKHGEFICDNERHVDAFPRFLSFFSFSFEQPRRLRAAAVVVGVHKDPLLIRLDVCTRIRHNGSFEAKRADTTAA